MTHFQYGCFKVCKACSFEIPWRYRTTAANSYPIFWRKSMKNCSQNVSFLFENNVKISQSQRKSQSRYYRCQCTSISSAADQQVEEVISIQIEEDDDDDWVDGKCGKTKGQFGNLVRENGWQVRRMVEEDHEMRSVADIQAEAFHEPVFLFNDMFFNFFQAEVLSGLLYRLRNSAADRYACLVAEPITSDDPADQQNQQLVGVVDVTVFRDKAVLEHLPGADEYLYVSGIAVLRSFRRKKVATVLLKACEMLANLWGYKYLVLRAYEDDWGARKLYSNAGYRIVSKDPPWTTSWIGRRRRVLMIKESNVT